ncbi:nonsense-mediated mRNA decay protein [Medicago truncatula]|nr:nonsense-mediated mRNA decay protein [Medicago truncatula]
MEEGWVGVLNVRQQHVCQLRTLFHLEQISVWTNFTKLSHIMRIKNKIDDDEGLSFCFNSLSDATDVVNLIVDILPSKVRLNMNMIPPEERCIFSVEIVPICCGDLIILPSHIAASFGPNIGPIVICTRVAKIFTLLDPFTLTHCFLKAGQYWDAPFTPSFSRPQLVEYVVLGINLKEELEELVEENKEKKKLIIELYAADAVAAAAAVVAAEAAAAKKYRLADAMVARVKDIGNNNHTTFQIKTHLGRILKPGDHALGYDLSSGGVDTNLPAAILITKISYAEEENGRVVAVQDKWESDYQLFLKDLQQDTKLLFDRRAIYRNRTNCHPFDTTIKSPFRRPFYPLEDLLDG